MASLEQTKLTNLKGFHPYTSIKLIDGTYIFIKDAKVDDTLEDGSTIKSIFQNPNKGYKPFNTIKNEGIHIFVMDDHNVFDKNFKQFVKVKDYGASGPTVITYDTICGILTDTGYIRIGTEIFKDW